MATDDGTLRAEDDGKPASAKRVQSYIARAFGDRLGEARAAMEAFAASLPPEELNRVGFRLYERFRPDVPEGAQGWGAKGELYGRGGGVMAHWLSLPRYCCNGANSRNRPRSSIGRLINRSRKRMFSAVQHQGLCAP